MKYLFAFYIVALLIMASSIIYMIGEQKILCWLSDRGILKNVIVLIYPKYNDDHDGWGVDQITNEYSFTLLRKNNIAYVYNFFKIGKVECAINGTIKNADATYIDHWEYYNNKSAWKNYREVPSWVKKYDAE